MNSNKLGLTKEVMATKVIPFLVPLSIENGLSLQQVNRHSIDLSLNSNELFFL